MKDAQNFDCVTPHAVRDDIGCTLHDKLACTVHSAGASHRGMRGKLVFNELDDGEDGLDRREGIVVTDVGDYGVEIAVIDLRISNVLS
jgi:hypothetical protein